MTLQVVFSPIPYLCQIAADVSGHPVDSITGPRREDQLVSLRDAIILVARDCFQLQPASIAKRLGNRNPATIGACARRARARRDADDAFRAFTDFLIDKARERNLP